MGSAKSGRVVGNGSYPETGLWEVLGIMVGNLEVIAKMKHINAATDLQEVLDLRGWDRRKAKLPTLLGPAERNVGAQPSERQVVRLTSFQDGLYDVGG